MRNSLFLPISFLALSLAVLICGCAAGLRTDDNEADRLRQVERERLRSLVEADVEVARRLHADDFQLITPGGATITKEQYLSAIESGQLSYRAWEPGEIAVRFYGAVAVIRYQDVRFEVYSGGRLVHRGEGYHTNVYERRDGQWQVVWSHASGGEFVDP